MSTRELAASKKRFEGLPDVLDWIITGAAWDAAKHLLKRTRALWKRRRQPTISYPMEERGKLTVTFSDVLDVGITVKRVHERDAEPPVNPTL